MQTFFSKPWRIFVLVTFVAGTVAFLSQSGRFKREISSLRNSFDILGGLKQEEAKKRTSEFSEELQLLIHGDTSASNEHDRWLAIYESQKESPLHYARYLQQSESLPENHRETVKKLAPQNAWFDFWEIVKTTEEAFEKLEPVEDDPLDEDSPPFLYEIHDEKAMEDAIELFHQAVSKDSFTDYYSEMQTMLQIQLSPPETWLEELEYRTDILSIDTPFSVGVAFTNFTSAALQFHLSRNDREGFLQLEDSAKRLAPMLHSNAGDAFSGLVFYTWLRNVSQNLIVGAKHFQLSEMEDKYRVLGEKIETHDELMNSANEIHRSNESKFLLAQHGSIIVRLATPHNFAADPVPITGEALKPSCRAENAVLSRIFTVAWYFLFICIAADLWIANLRVLPDKQSQVQEKLKRLGEAARWKVLLAGIFLPFCLLLAIRYFTPLGQLDYSGPSSDFVHLALPLTASGLFLISTAITSIRALTLIDSTLKLRDLLLPVLPLAAIITIGFYHLSGRKSEILYLATLLMITSFLWLIILAFQNRSKETINHFVKKHLMAPACIFAAGLFGPATWGLAKEESAWIAKDDFGSPEGHFITKYESKMVARFLNDLEDLLP